MQRVREEKYTRQDEVKKTTRNKMKPQKEKRKEEKVLPQQTTRAPFPPKHSNRLPIPRHFLFFLFFFSLARSIHHRTSRIPRGSPHLEAPDLLETGGAPPFALLNLAAISKQGPQILHRWDLQMFSCA